MCHVVADLFLASGDIPRQTSFETGLPGHHTWRGDQVTLDPAIHDERFLAANVRGRGTTALTACSHAGVVNVGLEARRLLPDQPVDLLLGGYHLAGAAAALANAFTGCAPSVVGTRYLLSAS